ncbi:MAG: hypothetical protein RR662_03915 [Clostridia bacterium]
MNKENKGIIEMALTIETNKAVNFASLEEIQEKGYRIEPVIEELNQDFIEDYITAEILALNMLVKNITYFDGDIIEFSAMINRLLVKYLLDIRGEKDDERLSDSKK